MIFVKLLWILFTEDCSNFALVRYCVWYWHRSLYKVKLRLVLKKGGSWYILFPGDIFVPLESVFYRFLQIVISELCIFMRYIGLLSKNIFCVQVLYQLFCVVKYFVYYSKGYFVLLLYRLLVVGLLVNPENLWPTVELVSIEFKLTYL